MGVGSSAVLGDSAMSRGYSLSKAQACEKQPYYNNQTHSPLSQTPQIEWDKDESQEKHENQKSKEKCRL
jgi:hypothetical protein